MTEPGRETLRQLGRITLDSVGEGRLPPEAVMPGVRALDLWSEGNFGAVLFWLEPEATPIPHGNPQLGVVMVTCADGPWRSVGYSAGATRRSWGDFLAGVAPGLGRCGSGTSGSRDRHDRTTWHKVCVTWFTAGSQVALIRLRDEDDNVRDHRPGRHGFALVGITPEDPLTCACGVGHDGHELPGEPITLWCAPYDTSPKR